MPEAYREEHPFEILGGRMVSMSPRPAINHNRIAGNIYRIFSLFLKGKSCEAFGDGVDLFLSEEDHFIPDGMVVCDKNKIRSNYISGAPDLVVEVLSPRTARNDRWHKKNAYETAGVTEYWIVERTKPLRCICSRREAIIWITPIHCCRITCWNR